MNDDRNEPYSTMTELFRPFLFFILGTAVGGGLVMLYLTPLLN